ncbi:hypothetical protein ACTFIR_009423 [Dictyostelium discoideum]
MQLNCTVLEKEAFAIVKSIEIHHFTIFEFKVIIRIDHKNIEFLMNQRQLTHDDSDTENEQSDNESSNNVNVPTEYQYKHMLNNQGLLVEEELNVAPFDVPEGIFVSSTVKNNDTNGLPSNVASGSNNTRSANGTNNRFQKNKK